MNADLFGDFEENRTQASTHESGRGEGPRRNFVIHADGGARGNPGPAAYGTTVHGNGALLAEACEYLGETTNNVAEYSGLIAGLELVRDLAADDVKSGGVDVVVRLDSKLVVEQMSGRWKIKNAVMRELALRARDLSVGLDVAYEWIPRAENSDADALVNDALDRAAAGDEEPLRRLYGGEAAGAGEAQEVSAPTPGPAPGPAQGDQASEAVQAEGEATGLGHPGAGPDLGPGTRLVLVRHGHTAGTGVAFPGRDGSGVAGSSPGPSLDAVGRAEAAAQATRLAAEGLTEAVVVSSPAARCLETAQVIAAELGATLVVDPELVECDFGTWSGMTLNQVRESHPEDLAEWMRDSSSAPHHGESFADVLQRARMVRSRWVAERPGQSTVLVTHAVLLAGFLADALDADPAVMFRWDVQTGAASEVRWYADGGRAVVEVGVRGRSATGAASAHS